MSSGAHRRLVHDYYRAIDAGDLAEALTPFDDDCVYERQGHGVITGAEALREFYFSQRVIARGDHRLDEVLAAGEWVAVRGTFAGTLVSGEDVELAFTDWFCIRGLRIVYRQSLFPGRRV